MGGSVGKRANQVHLVLTGKLLAVARQSVGLSQSQVAEAIGCSQSNIAQIERSDYAEPSTEILSKLSELYGLDINDVVASIVAEKYGIDFSTSPVPRNLRKVVSEKMKAKIDKELGL